MNRRFILLAAVLGLGGVGLAVAQTTQPSTKYTIDKAHTAVYFRIMHLGLSYTYGRFNDVNGKIKHPGQYDFTIKTASVDTANKKRDGYLRGPDFFNVRQFPTISFKTTKTHVSGDKIHVTGDLTMHGVTKSITLTLTKLGEGKDPWGKYRIGFATELDIKRSDFGMTKMPEMVADDVRLMISFEATR